MGEREEEQRPNVQAKSIAIRIANLPAIERAQLLDQAIERYSCGESVYQIASELGVEHTTLYRHLVAEREDQWKSAKIAKALVEVEDAEEAMKSASDMLALSRARERCRAAQWQLERLLRRIYGQDQPQSVAPVQINITMRTPEQNVHVVESDA